MLEHKKIDSKNRTIYKNKKLIKIIYQEYYKIIKKFLYVENQNLILELGSGGGNIKKIIPKCITSDQFKKKNIDRIENIYKINFKKNSISNIILIDVFHHLKFPALALEQIHRVLIKKGRVIMVEPAMGLIPRIIYKLFHYEPNGFEININWQKKPLLTPNPKSYFAAQSLPWRAFILKELNLKNKFSIKSNKPFSDFAFLLSGGYSFRSFYPKKIYPIIRYIDKILTKVSILLFSARMLVILEKK
jgi:SAM-dependent methyltransferase